MLVHDGFLAAKTRDGEGRKRSLGERTRKDETTARQRIVAEDHRTVQGEERTGIFQRATLTIRLHPCAYQRKFSVKTVDDFCSRRD